MKKLYHDYVYDFDNKVFKGKFENMYRDEARLNFDSWFQEDQRHLKRQINKLLLSQYNFSLILDIGCGKGSFTHQLKRKNNEVIGIDISKTAIKIAKNRYPDIKFMVNDLNNTSRFMELGQNFKIENNLVCMVEVLSYIRNWKGILNILHKNFDYCLINLYLPPKPIGYIKKLSDLINHIKKFYLIEYEITINNQREIIILLKSKYYE